MRSSRRELIVGIGAAVAVGLVSVLVPASSASTTAVVLETVARAVAVGLPVAVGLVAWRRPPFERFGRLLVATGAAVLVVTLSLSDNALLYSTGRVVHWGVEAALVYLILAFPSGGLTQRVDRALAAAAVDLGSGSAGGTFASLLDFRLDARRRAAITERTLAEHRGGVPRPLIEAVAGTLEAGAAILAVLHTGSTPTVLDDSVARSHGRLLAADPVDAQVLADADVQLLAAVRSPADA